MPGNGKKISESEILKFVDAHINSFTTWDIVLFFFHNQTAVESAATLANRLGRSESDIKDCLCDLEKNKFLAANDGGTFQYDPPEELASSVEDFDRALADSKLRLAILSQVLSKGRLRP